MNFYRLTEGTHTLQALPQASGPWYVKRAQFASITTGHKHNREELYRTVTLSPEQQIQLADLEKELRNRYPDRMRSQSNTDGIRLRPFFRNFFAVAVLPVEPTHEPQILPLSCRAPASRSAQPLAGDTLALAPDIYDFQGYRYPNFLDTAAGNTFCLVRERKTGGFPQNTLEILPAKPSVLAQFAYTEFLKKIPNLEEAIPFHSDEQLIQALHTGLPEDLFGFAEKFLHSHYLRSNAPSAPEVDL